MKSFLFRPFDGEFIVARDREIPKYSLYCTVLFNLIMTSDAFSIS